MQDALFITKLFALFYKGLLTSEDLERKKTKRVPAFMQSWYM
jgi:hypothetical protein